ncbi:MAG: hypothetical protein Tsb009_12300 [Planctomycetaceae bacterium]
MMDTLTEIYEQLRNGEIITQEDLWWALLIGMMFAALHLITMLVTRWGDHQATSKSLIFSVLVHLSCGMGLVAMNPPESPEKEKSPEKTKEPEKDDPFKFDTKLLAGSETFATSESGNTPFYRKLPKPIKVALARRDFLPLNLQPMPAPIRKTSPVQQMPIVEPSLPQQNDLDVATPLPVNSGQLGQPRFTKAPKRIFDSTLPRQRITQNPTPRNDRIRIQRPAQTPNRIIRETSRGAVDQLANNLDLDPKLSTDNAPLNPTASLKRSPDTFRDRLRRAPRPSPLDEKNTGAPAPRKTAGTGGGNQNPRQQSRIATRTIGGVPRGGVIRSRPDIPPRIPRPNSTDPKGLLVGPTPRAVIPGPRPNVRPLASTLRTRRRTSQLPATYRLRTLSKRKASAEKYGGTDASELAVEKALRWLARHQHPEGYWDADLYGAGKIKVDERGTNRDYAGKDSDTGVTALALLAFLGAGYTHEEGPYATTVDKALRWLIAQQKPNGFFGGNARHYAKMYCHGMVTYALAEAYGMQSDPTVDTRLREPLAKAVAYILDAQSQRDGGWRYLKGQVSDMSMFGWQLMALKSAETAGLKVPDNAKRRMIQFLLDHSSGANKGLASYQKDYKVSAAMTAEALFCKQIFRIPRNHPASKEAAEYLVARKPRRSQLNLYYWYYGTLAMFQYGGPEWDQWNTAIRQALVADQVSSGDNEGSWDPKGPWGPYGGRVYSTALSALCLEVYYRFLPLYKMSGQKSE